MNRYYLCFDPDSTSYGYENDEYIPERSLLAAVLGRALQDLSNQKERVQALRWFLTPSDSDVGGISYQLCLSVLQLGTLHINLIKQRILDTLSGKNTMTKLQRLRRVSK